MVDFPKFPEPRANKLMLPDDFSAAIQRFVDYFPAFENAVNQIGPEMIAKADAKNYDPSKTYNQTGYTVPDFVYGSDGITYVCIGSDVSGDDPVGSNTGNWKGLLLALEDITPPVGMEKTGGIIGGDYWNGADNLNDLDLQPFSCSDSTGTIPIKSDTVLTVASDAAGVNGMLGGAKQANDILDLWVLKGTSGVCAGLTRNGIENINDITLPAGYADAFRWFGPTAKLDGVNLPEIICLGSFFQFMNGAQSTFFAGTVGTSWTSFSLSGLLPDNRYTAVMFGANDNDNADVYFSSDGGSYQSKIQTYSSNMGDWGYSKDLGPFMAIKNNAVFVKQSVSNATALRVRAAILRR